ncbi:MAG: glycine zipper protein [Chitinophagaceae bacterium]|nr:glycine zipper protein [Chitinophagaceae bacterium]MDB5222134.1 glycine zipper protein [Chitinophagaceae bacterium]
MKKILHCFMVASIFVACNSKTDLDTKKDMILTDTTGMYKSNMMTDTGSVITTTLTNGNQNTAVANRRTTNTNNNRSTASTSNNRNTGSGQTTTVTRRRGWSHAAKNAAIGGVGGAVVGAVISKNKVKGAVIGGVLGAGGGYILGRSKDKKEGRY